MTLQNYLRKKIKLIIAAQIKELIYQRAIEHRPPYMANITEQIIEQTADKIMDLMPIEEKE